MASQDFASAYLVLESGPDAFGELFNFFGLFEAGDRKNVGVVFLDLLFQTLRQFYELSGILDRFVVIGFQDLILLKLSVGEAHAGGFLRLVLATEWLLGA